jgi:uncharacterized protein YggE
MARMARSGIVCLAVFTAVAAVAPARAQIATNQNGVTVIASGEVRAKPTAVEIDVTVADGDARAGDAIGKYAEAKKRLLEACGNLKLATLAIEEQAIKVTAEPGQAQFGNAVIAVPQVFAPAGVAGQLPKGPEIRVARTIRLTLKGIRDKPEAEVLATIGTILDAVRDAGGTVGPPQENFPFVGVDNSVKSVCRFVLEDAPELRKKAIEQALAQARNDAGLLAGGRVGAVLALAAAADDSPGPQPVNPYAGFFPARAPDDSRQRTTSDRFTEIPVRVTVQATFRLE